MSVSKKSSGTHSKDKINVWYFHSAGIGSFLLAVHTVERVYFSIPASQRGNCYIVASGDVSLSKKIAQVYSHIQVIRCNRSNLFDIVPALLSSFFQINYIFHAASFGEPSILHKLASVLLRISCPKKAVVVGFCRKNILNKLFFTNLFVRDPNISLFKSTIESIATVLPVDYHSPQLLFPYDVTLNSSKEPIIFHPFPKSERRALPEQRNKQILNYLVSHYSGSKIIVSGGPENRKAYQRLSEGCGDKVSFICDVAPDFLGQISIISTAKLFVGVDTGITHVASVLGCDVVLLGNLSNQCWMPTYSKKTVILTSKKNCTCRGEKQGGCGEDTGDGIKRYSCLVNIEQSVIYKEIDKVINSH